MLRKTLFYLVMFAIVFAVLEAFALVVNLSKDPKDIYDHRQGEIARLNEQDLASFVRNSAHPLMGWDHFGPRVDEQTTCSGAKVRLTHNALGARIYQGYDEDQVDILVFGDSYTNGAETGDEETYPAQLARLLGVSVANHGVGGYGPVQSYLSLTAKIHHYPRARFVVLGIMYENIYRMVNSYRPVLYQQAFDYGLKPYMAGGKIVPHPGPEVFEDIGRFKESANRAFDNDFWRKPRAEFPYSVSLVRGLSSNYFLYRQFQKNWRKVGIPEYFLAFRSEDFLAELFALLDGYAQFAARHGLKPVVVFIPRNRYDTQSVGKFIEANRERFPAGLLIGDVGGADIDWEKFNLIAADDSDPCHPSTYGYRKIAEYVAGLLRDAGFAPAPGVAAQDRTGGG